MKNVQCDRKIRLEKYCDVEKILIRKEDSGEVSECQERERECVNKVKRALPM
jgi:hypothetical protein